MSGRHGKASEKRTATATKSQTWRTLGRNASFPRQDVRSLRLQQRRLRVAIPPCWSMHSSAFSRMYMTELPMMQRSKLNRLEQKAAHCVSFACSEAQIGHKSVQWTRSIRNFRSHFAKMPHRKLAWRTWLGTSLQKWLSEISFFQNRRYWYSTRSGDRSIDQPARQPSSPVSVVPYNQPLTSDPLDPEGKRFLQQWNDESQQKSTWGECCNSDEMIWNYVCIMTSL